MPKFIIEHVRDDGTKQYLIWSTIVDAPLTFAGTLDQTYESWQEMYGGDELERVILDIARRGFKRLDDVVPFNRAGKGETRLTREHLVDYYFDRCGQGERP